MSCDLDEPDPFTLAEDRAAPGEGVLARPDLGAEVEVVQPELFGELPAQGCLEVFALVDAAAGRGPPDLAFVVAELDEERALVLVEDERADRAPVDGLERVGEGAEPVEPLGDKGPLRSRVRSRKNEEADVADRSLLRAVLGACAERAAVRLLADECDGARPELEGDAPQVVFGVGEVGAAEVARPWCRAGGCVRRADAEVEQLELLSWLEQPSALTQRRGAGARARPRPRDAGGGGVPHRRARSRPSAR